MNKKRKIRNFLLIRDFQLKYIALIVGSGFVLAATHLWVNYQVLSESQRILFELVPSAEEVRNQLEAGNRHILIYLALSSLFFLAIFSIISLVFSHRVAGPLFRLQRTFDQIREGDRDLRIRLRPGDDFQGIVESFNEMMDGLNAEMKEKN